MSKGKRYDGEQKLNIKKVIITVIVFIMIIVGIVGLIKFFKHFGNKKDTKNVAISYISVFKNGKFGVINSKGEEIINATYDNILIIPDATQDVFLYNENLNLSNKTYSSGVINKQGKKLFTEYDRVDALQSVDSNGNVIYSNKVLKFYKDGKYGLISFSGTVLVDAIYDDIQSLPQTTNVLLTIKNSKKGLIDSAGSIIIENEYSDISLLTNNYENGFIVKNDAGRYGVITFAKKKVLDTVYSEIKHVYGSGYYVVKTSSNEMKLIDADGNSKLSGKFDDVLSIDNEYVVIKKGNKYQVVDLEGNIKLKDYDYIEYIFDTYYIAKKGTTYGIVDINNEVKVDFKYKNIVYRKDAGFIEGNVDDLKSDLISSSFEVKVTGIISEVNESLGYIKVKVDGDYKYYNLRFEEKNIKDILKTNTLFSSEKDGKFGFVNKDGQVIVDYIYDDVTEENAFGYIGVKKDGKWGVIDYNGKVIMEPSLELKNNPKVDFIGNLHLCVDLNANYYTDVNE